MWGWGPEHGGGPWRDGDGPKPCKNHPGTYSFRSPGYGAIWLNSTSGPPGKKKKNKAIYGKASREEIEDLKQEGIKTEEFPWIEDKEN